MSAETKTFGGPQLREVEVDRWVRETVAYARTWGMDERLARELAKHPPPPAAEHEQGHR